VLLGLLPFALLFLVLFLWGGVGNKIDHRFYEL